MTLGRGRTVALTVAIAVLLVTAVGSIPYQRQVRSYVTHWKGSPPSTEPYRPLPSGEILRVVVAGDVGDSGSRLTATADAVDRLGRSDPYDVLLLLGDNVYPSGDPTAVPRTVFQPFAPVLDRGARLLAILGNHDEPNGDAQLEVLGMPGPWWSTEVGDVLFVGLDSNHADDDDQRAWLEATLRDSDAPWKIVSVHQSPYSAGYQGSSTLVRERFVPLFERHGVQLVLSGHDHDYQRSNPLDGVTYVVTGAAAGTRRTGAHDFTAVSFSWHSFVELGIYDDRIVGRALNQSERMADEWVISR